MILRGRGPSTTGGGWLSWWWWPTGSSGLKIPREAKQPPRVLPTASEHHQNTGTKTASKIGASFLTPEGGIFGGGAKKGILTVEGHIYAQMPGGVEGGGACGV